MAEEYNESATKAVTEDGEAKSRGIILDDIAEQKKSQGEQEGEVKDRGLFDFVRKKEEKSPAEVLVTGVEKLHVEEKKEEGEKKESLLEKLRSHSSSSSSSSDEEEVGGGENKEKKKKKKKGLKEKIKEKLHGDKTPEGEEEKVTAVVAEQETVVVSPAPAAHHHHQPEDTSIPIETATPEEEKKGFLDKIKEKLPGHHKKEEAHAAEAVPAGECPAKEKEAEDGKEKKGILGKLMEKLPGYHKEETEKTTPPSH